jgi:4-amino-4-deoxy-L-arabinose transferase-like glycosyltransferase
MAIKDFSQFMLYRWRYLIGYAIIGLLLAGMLVFAGLFVPGGLTDDEKQSVIISEALNIGDISTFVVTHLPYHLLQAASMEMFGISEFSIKLPSLVLGLFAAVGLIVLLRRWFKPNIAVLASLIAVTTGQFLFIAQSGTPLVVYLFWPVALLLLGTQITRMKKMRLLWKVLFTACVALSLYSPLAIYPLIAIFLTIALHPHLRTAVRRLSKPMVMGALAFFFLLTAPLAWMVTISPDLGLALLGVPPEWPNLWTNLQTLAGQFFIFWRPEIALILTPVFGFASILLIIMGMYRLFITREATHSYLIISWSLALLPVLLINPEFTNIVFVPAVLLLAAGLTGIISYWYRLFPFNPYARITGLIPLIVLVVSLLGAGLDRYVYGYYYAPTSSVYFSQDLQLLPQQSQTLLVTPEEKPFFDAVSAYRPDLVVVTSTELSGFTATRNARPATHEGLAVTRIITSPASSEADRFYQYQKLAE